MAKVAKTPVPEKACEECDGAGEVPGRYTGPLTVQCPRCKGKGTEPDLSQLPTPAEEAMGDHVDAPDAAQLASDA
jgi:hypothetical protein